MTGTYAVTITDSKSCTATASEVVTVNQTPVISSTSSTNPSTCTTNDGSITLNGLNNSVAYTVNYTFNGTAQTPLSVTSNGSGQIILSGLAPGTYAAITVTLVSSNCISASVGPFTLVNPSVPAAPTVGSNSPVCTGSSISLTASGAGGNTYSWTGPVSFSTTVQNPTRSSATTAMSGSYCATQTALGSCVSPQACTTVTVNPAPSISGAVGSNPTTCGGSQGSITLSGLTSGYTYTITYSLGGVAQTPLSLTANGSGQVIITGLAAGSYSTFIAAIPGCSNGTLAGPVVLSNPANPSPPTVGSNSPVCSGNAINLTASTIAGATYHWTGPLSYTSTAQNPTIAGSTTAMSGSYCAVDTVANCVSSQACTSVLVNQTPAVSSTASSNPTTCGGTQGTITLNGLTSNVAYSVTYSLGGVATGPFTFTANGSGQLIITGLGAGSYTNIIATLVSTSCPAAPVAGPIVLSNPSNPAAPTVGSNSPVCSGNAINLTASTVAGATYKWTGPLSYTSTAQNPSIANSTTTMSGSYCVADTVANCVSTQACVTVTVNQTPAAPTAAASPNPICSGNQLTLTATGTAGATFNWFYPDSATAHVGNPITRFAVTTAMSGTYTVTQTVTGCTSTASGSVVVTVNATPVISSSSSTNPTTCGGTQGTITLNGLTALANYSVTYKLNGTTTGPVTIAANGTGQVIITGLGAGSYTNIIATLVSTSCPSAPVAGPIVLSNPSTPVAPTVGSNSPVCSGNSINLTAATTAGATYSWTGPLSYSSTNQNPTITGSTTAMTGSYCATQTVAACTSPQACVTVTVNPTPVISSSSSTNPTTCGGTNGTISLTGLTASTTYTVNYTLNGTAQTPVSIASNGSGVLTITGLGIGAYTNIFVTLTGCPSAPVSGTITLSNPASPLAPTPGSNSPVCTGNTLSLTATGAGGATYSWTGPLSYSTTVQNPTVSASATAGMAGSYCVTQTVANCTGPSACTTVVVNTTPAITSTSSTNPTTCGGTQGTITINGLLAGSTYAVTYVLNGVSQGPVSLLANGSGQVIITGLNAGAYTNIVVSLNNCPSAPTVGTITLSNPSTPAAPTVGSNTPVCSGNAINLTATGAGGATYSWTGPSGYTNTNQNPSIANAAVGNAGSYCATQTVANCTSPQACTTVVVNPTPVIGGSSSVNPTTCGGTNGSITLTGLTASATCTVNYALNGTAQTPSNITANGSGQLTITGLGAGNYTNIVVTLTGCPSAPLSGTITLANPSNPAAPTVGSNSPVCQNGTITLTASGAGGATYSWTGPLSYSTTTQNPTVTNSATVAMGGSYCATQTVAACTSVPACVSVTVFPLPVITSATGTNPATCGGNSGSVTLNGLTASSTYTVNYSKNGTAQTPVSITANGSGQVIITGLTIGTYSNIVVTLNGCNSAAAGPVTLVNPNGPNPATTSSNSPVCSGTALTLGVATTAGATYQWSGPLSYSSTNQNPTVSATATTAMSGTYKVIITLNACQDSGTVTVLVNQSPVANAGNGGSFCSGTGGSVTLGGSPTGTGVASPFTYAWSPAGSLGDPSSPNPLATPTTTTIYTVTVTDAVGCISTATTTVTVNQSPTASAGNPRVICSGNTITIGGAPTASGGTGTYTYNWSGGAAAVANPSVSPTTTTTYTVSVFDGKGCSATASVNIVVRALPVASAGGNLTIPSCSPTGLAIGGTPTASGGSGSGYTYSWSPSVGLSSTTIANPISQGLLVDTTYTVVVTDGNGCSASASMRVHVTNNAPVVNITNSGAASWCAGTGNSVNLTANITNGTTPFTYSWGGTNITPTNTAVATVNPNTAGSYVYNVSVTDNFGCSGTATYTVTVNPAVTASAGSAQSVCSGSSITIGGSPTGSGGTGTLSYAWNNGASATANPSVSPLASTTYTVTVTDTKGCSAAANTTVTVKSVPTVSAGSNVPLSSYKSLFIKG